MKKYIFVTGGVCSSLGKGIAAASLGNLLEHRGLHIRMIKIDPYINVDAGTMSPYQHGEVYVTDDGAETDLDLGNYARFTRAPLNRQNSITTGQIYREVINKEREGRYLGKTVQVIPHITDEIKQRIFTIGEQADVDVTIIEIGGTVGDIESIPFIEAARQFIHDIGKEHVLFIHLTLVPEVGNGELKTKPTQHSVKELENLGIQPDILMCRSSLELPEQLKSKIALFTNVDREAVISAYNFKNSIYELPLVYHRQRLDDIVVKKLSIPCQTADMQEWEEMVNRIVTARRTVRIGIVGKYVELYDSYKSIHEALAHGGIANGVKVELVSIDSEELETVADIGGFFQDIDGIIVPGGFGQRGIEGMIKTAGYARTHNIPYFGICLGMQVMVIEYGRTIPGFADANSSEFAPDCTHPVVSLLEEQISVKNYGGTMRLGKYESVLVPGTRLREIYGSDTVSERHRHRYEVSNKFLPQLEEAGLIVCARNSDGILVESVQWPNHRWGIGVQFHPEFKSSPTKPHPLFKSFIEASLNNEG